MLLRITLLAFGLILIPFAAHAELADALAQNVAKYFGDFDYSNAALSPDGQSVAIIHADRPGVTNLVIIDLNTLQQKQITDLFHSRIGWVHWIDNDTLAFNVHDEAGWVREAMVYNVISKNGGDLVEAGLAYGGWSEATGHARDILDMDFIGPVPGHSGMEYVSSRSQNQKSYYPSLYEFDWHTGTLTAIEGNNHQIIQWFMNPNGQLLAAMAVDDKLHLELLYRATSASAWQILTAFDYGKPGLWPIGFDQGGKQLYVLSDIGTSTLALRLFDVATKKLGPILFEDPKSDIQDVVFSDTKYSPLAVAYGYNSADIIYLDPARAAVAKEIGARTGLQHVVLQASKDGDTFLAYAYSDPYPGSYYVLRKSNDKLIKLLDVTDRFEKGSLAQQKAIIIKARDGVPLLTYVTIPIKGHGPWPVVVLVHGGPYGVRDYPGYDPEVQLLASQGYAVLQVNFRGSGGFGRIFEQLGWKQWGAGIQNDIADATRWALAHGIAESRHVCIYGASFGGYSALMSLVRYPELFQCGISLAGVTDIKTLLQYEEKNSNPLVNAWLSYVLGDVKLDKNTLETESPYYNIGKIRSPIFLSHGANDTTVPLEQTIEFADKFKKEGKTRGQLLILPKEGHGIDQPETQVQFYSELVKFLETNIGVQHPHQKMAHP